MNLQTVCDNLKNTIAGKQKVLDTLKNPRDLPPGADMAVASLSQFLEINIDELKRILVDVEACR